MTGLDDLELTPTAGGTTLRLRVRAGAQRTALQGIHAGALKLSVTTAPEKGKANKTVLELIARALGLPRTELELVSGTSAPDKVIRIPLTPTQVRTRLAEA